MQDTQLDKYFCNDRVFDAINKEFISLQDDDVKRINKYLKQVVGTLIDHMKAKDSLFEKTYKDIIFCGSFYKGTKVKRPNEFDLNIVLKLPLNYKYIKFNSGRPAFVIINLEDPSVFNTATYNKLSNSEKRLKKKFKPSVKNANNSYNSCITYNKLYYKKHWKKIFMKYVTNQCLDPNKFRAWIEGIVDKVIKQLPEFEDKHVLSVNGSHPLKAQIKTKKSGPAFTIMLQIPQEIEEIHVDLAPALIFPVDLINSFISRLDLLQNCRNKTWFAIPVPFSNNFNTDLHWRLSFSLQEKEILTKYGRIKPVVRQMKKLRDEQNWRKMASYFIETLVVTKLVDTESLRKDLDKIPLTLFLFKMLKELHCTFKEHKLSYFWNQKYNLLSKIDQSEMHNMACRLGKIIKDIESNIINDTFVLAKYILNQYELSRLKEELNYEQPIKNYTFITEPVACEVNPPEDQPSNQWRCIIE